MSVDFIPEQSIQVPTVVSGQKKLDTGIVVPGALDPIALPEGAGKVARPEGYTDTIQVAVPEGDDVLAYSGKEQEEREPISPAEVVRALGHFDAYFDGRVQEFFPAHDSSRSLSSEAVARGRESKTFFDRYDNTRKERVMSMPGPIEEECITAMRIASTPEFAHVGVDALAITKATKLLKAARTSIYSDEAQERLPEMPDLLREAENYLGRASTERRSRFEVYNLLEQIELPDSEVPQIFELMTHNKDWAHPLYVRAKAAAYSSLVGGIDRVEQPWHTEQMVKRAKLLRGLDFDPQVLFGAYAEYSGLARDLVCSVDPQRPPRGKIGVEIEFGLKDETMPDPDHFRTYDGGDNQEISRRDDALSLDGTYLRDLAHLRTFLGKAATHISSLHIHLDRNLHPESPEMNALLGNLEGSTVVKSGDKPTWEVRGLLPPVYADATDLDPAALADIIQLYISASEHPTSEPGNLLTLPDGPDPTLEQIIFAHICRAVPSPEGRLAALKVLEHPFTLKAVDPRSLIEDYATDAEKARVYQVLKQGLKGKFAKRSLRAIAKMYGFEGEASSYERLTHEDITEQYMGLVATLGKNGVLKELSAGGRGIIDIEGKERQVPSLEEVLRQIQEKEEILGPKMEQGFRKLLMVPMGMKIEDLTRIYADALRTHSSDGRLLATKEDTTDADRKLELNVNEPVWMWNSYRGADTSGDLVYYPSEFSGNHQGQTKKELLASGNTGWRILLVEDLPNLPGEGLGETMGGRAQLEANRTPEDYLRTLQTNPTHSSEVGLTPEDWLTYALTHLEATDQVVDDFDGNGKFAYLPGAYFKSSGVVPGADWSRSYKLAYLNYNFPRYQHVLSGVRVAVRVN